MNDVGTKIFICVYVAIEIICIISLIRIFIINNRNKPTKMVLIDVEDNGSIFGTSGFSFYLSFLMILILFVIFIYTLPAILFIQMSLKKSIGPGREITFIFKDENENIVTLKSRGEIYRLIGLKDVRIGDVCDINSYGINITKAKIDKSARY